MKTISLLPPELKERQRKRRELLATALVTGTVVLVCLIVYAGLGIAVHLQHGELRELQVRRASLVRQASAYSRYAEMERLIAGCEGIYRQAVGNPRDYCSLLSRTGLILPDGVWLSDFQAQDKGEQEGAFGELRLSGWAFDHRQVAALLKNLKSVPGVADVRCQVSSEQEAAGLPLIRFEIKASLPKDTGGAGTQKGGGS